MHDQPLLSMSLPSIPSFVLSGLLLLCLPFSSFASATTSHITFSYAARQRMQNRARLLKQYQTHLKKQASYIVEGNAESRRALRQHNREQIKQHPEWFPAPLKASDRRWQALAENNHFLSSDHLHNITEVAIHRLEQQLGKPYVWGGTRPDQGFDCSGLVFYAYNKILEATGIDPDTRVRDLTEDQVGKIREYIDHNLSVEGDLKREVKLNIKRLTEIGCYRGIRHRKGLPVRGQNTKQNARTRKGPKKTVSRKKK